MAFDPLLATSILIFMIFSEKESLVPQYKTSDSYLHPYFILYHTVELWISISNMLFSHRFFSHKGNIWSPVFTGFQKTIATGFNIAYSKLSLRRFGIKEELGSWELCWTLLEQKDCSQSGKNAALLQLKFWIEIQDLQRNIALRI